MELPRHTELFAIASGLLLSTEYEPAEVGPGRLTLRATDPVSGDSREGTIRLDPGFEGTYQVEEWSEGGAILLGGGDRLVVLDVATLRVQAALPWEYKEAALVGFPWFVFGSNTMFVVTETRILCLDRRLAFRWCWTVRNESPEWVQMQRPPVIDGAVLRVFVRTMSREWELRLGVEDAARLDGPRRG